MFCLAGGGGGGFSVAALLKIKPQVRFQRSMEEEGAPGVNPSRQTPHAGGQGSLGAAQRGKELNSCRNQTPPETYRKPQEESRPNHSLDRSKYSRIATNEGARNSQTVCWATAPNETIFKQLQVLHTLHSSNVHGLLRASQRGKGWIRGNIMRRRARPADRSSFPSVQTQIFLPVDPRGASDYDDLRLTPHLWRNTRSYSFHAGVATSPAPATHFLLPNDG